MAHGFKHTIHCKHHHFGWDNSLAPVKTIAPGDTLFCECVDSSAGQITPESTVATVAALDFGRVNPVTGPVAVDGAEPGDVLKITLLDFEPSGWGWTAIIPGFGLLADQFKAPALNIWKYETSGAVPALYGKNARVPLKFFAGTIGLALREPGTHSVVPPRHVGGNLDIRDLAKGASLYLPVDVPGALLSIGDTHAAQGDGEVCGTAIESPMNVAVQVELIKNQRLNAPRFTTPGPVTHHLDAKGYEVTTGVGPDLMAAAKGAVANMIDLLCAQEKMRPEEAYMLCSVCGDLRISEIVDMPNWVVSFYFPRVVVA